MPPPDRPADEESSNAENPLDDVDEQLAAVDAAVRVAASSWVERVRERSIGPLAGLLRAAAVAHEQAVELLADEASTEHVASYREALHAQVLHPIHGLLEANRPGAALEAALADLLDGLRDAASGLDEVIDRAEPADLFQPDPADARVRRLRKTGVRARRSLQEWRRRAGNALRRLTRRPWRAAAQPVQHVPLKRLVTFHVLVRLPSELQRRHEELCRKVARTLAGLGRGATDHVHAVLEGERVSSVEEDAASGDALREHAARFQAMLEETAKTFEAFDEFGKLDEELTAWHARLYRDARESGTFMLDLSRRDVERGPAVRSRADDRFAAWSNWYGRVTERIYLLTILLRLKAQTEALHAKLTREVLAAGVTPARSALRDVEERLRSLSAGAQKDFEAGISAADVGSLLEGALDAVERGLLVLLQEGGLPAQVRAVCDDVSVGLSGLVQDLTEQLELNVLDETGSVDPERPPKRVALREHAERAYDALLVERLRRSTDHITNGLAKVRDDAAGVPEILRFNLGSAADDLRRTSEGDAYAAAREFVVDGLARSADILASEGDVLHAAVALFRENVEAVFEDGFSDLHQRVRVEEPVREQMLDLKSGAEAGLRRIAGRASEHSRRLLAVVHRSYRAERLRVSTWVRLGQAAAGLAAVTEEERLETVDALADTDRLLDGFPLVYRRLFSFEPVRDAALLEGRERELRFARSHVERWKRGQGNPLVITGFHGSGQTSFLNVLRETVLSDADVRFLDLRRRYGEEAALVEALVEALGLQHGPVATFEELAAVLFARDASAPNLVCLIEHLEHLYLRQIGGTDLVEGFLAFLSRTDSRILWIATVSDYGWQVIRTAAPSASSLVVVQALAPLGRAGLESIILNRHRRSGLPLEFDARAAEANPILARRYRKAESKEERQAILHTEYFDRLQRASGQNIMLALLYWLRSVEMDREKGMLRVRSVDPLRFGFLEAFDMEQAFTLKALLEHASLTVEEHSEVFHLPTGRSIEAFEALSNLLLIEPMQDRHVETRIAVAAVEEGVRYRVRPLLIHPIIQYLRRKNILH